jgi:hypothetical protein
VLSLYFKLFKRQFNIVRIRISDPSGSIFFPRLKLIWVQHSIMEVRDIIKIIINHKKVDPIIKEETSIIISTIIMEGIKTGDISKIFLYKLSLIFIHFYTKRGFGVLGSNT